MALDTMRRVRSYKHGTDVRAASRAFQSTMLVNLINIQARRIRVARANRNI